MTTHPELVAATQALRENNPAKAEALMRACLQREPKNASALKLLAHIAAGTGFAADAEQLLRRAIAIEPAFIEAHADLASLLCRLGRAAEAIKLLDRARVSDPRAIWPLALKIGVLDAERRTEEALPLHEALVERAPDAAIPWINYGHALSVVGRTGAAVVAYRKALDIDPASGFAWWGLACLRTVQFGPNDIALMERALSPADITPQQIQLHFALGRALGEQGSFEQSFRHYETANRIRSRLTRYDPRSTRELVGRVEAVFNVPFLTQRKGTGCAAPDPIFIVGMPRAGSTLVEQILASHPMVEGCGELFELQNLVAHLAQGHSPQTTWLDAIAKMDARELHSLGERYLASVRRHRKTDRPFFTDKMPANWRYVGVIHLILPNARIIDVRRDPMACCFSAFATYFNRETDFPADLEGLGRYHADYMRMIAHFDRVLPATIRRVQYESLIADPEREVRGLLDDLRLPFDMSCLRFHDTPRAVHTPSAQQVRRPINGEGLGFWRNYEPWLASLKKGFPED